MVSLLCPIENNYDCWMKCSQNMKLAKLVDSAIQIIYAFTILPSICFLNYWKIVLKPQNKILYLLFLLDGHYIVTLCFNQWSGCTAEYNITCDCGQKSHK